MIELRPLTGELLTVYGAAEQGIYGAAFATDTGQAARFLENALGKHVSYVGVAGLVAVDGDRVVGITYGYRSEPGQWWHDTVGPALRAAGHRAWMEEAFEFVELAVDPAMQGQGIGGRLHDDLLGNRPEKRALLSTTVDRNPARAIYERRGWVPLLDPFQYPGGGDAAAIMGLELAKMRSGAGIAVWPQ